MPYPEILRQPSATLEARSLHEATLARYTELLGHTNPLPLPEAADLVFHKTIRINPQDHTNIYNQLWFLTTRLNLDKTRIPPDVSIFFLDRKEDKPQLKSRFGWRDISLSQSARVLGVLSEPANFYVASQLELAIGETYPSLSPFLDDQETDIPARFFLNCFDALLPENERGPVEQGIRNYELSPMEYTLLNLITRGKTNEQITENLEGNYQTTKNYLSHLYAKFWKSGTPAYDRTQAGIIAIQEGLFPPSLILRLPEADKTGKLHDLSSRETEVLQLVASGLINKQIAQRLVISDQTVKNHITEILSKLGCPDRTAASLICHIAALNGQAEPEE